MLGLSSFGTRKSHMNHQFSNVPSADIPRSTFNRSHSHKTAFDAGYLVPFYVDEALPGDTFNLNANIFARLSTPIVPQIDMLHLDTFFFAVPIRLVWTNFVKMMGEQDNPSDSTSYTTPQMTATASIAIGSLADYMGIPTGLTNTIAWSNLWGRAYNLIWNEWFRDENLQNSVTVDVDDGPDTYADYTLLQRGKRHDYFTSCLPWPQKGTAVSIPLGTRANVLGIGKANSTFPLAAGTFRESDGTTSVYADYALIDNSSGDNVFGVEKIVGNSYPNIWADLSTATAATINELRQAFQIQKLYERDARGGTRYTEIIRSHFGVVSPDARLQRPEYLGGASRPILMNPVPQTSATSGSNPLGLLAAFGTVSSPNNGFTKSFTEHTLLIGLVNVRAEITYQQGLHRMFSRSTRFTYYWPALAHIGEQAVLNKEIWADGSATDTATFGYQERWAEYRYKPSLVTGKLRSNASGTLDLWHYSEDFATLPALNSAFIVDPTETILDRCLAVPTEPDIIMDSYINLICARPMPVYSVPGQIDRF